MTPVLDSSFIVDLLRGNERALKKLVEMEVEYSSLRSYPKSPAALNVIHAHAKCSIAR